MVVMGFGFGALLMSKLIGPALMQMTGDDIALTFMYIGLIMGATVAFGAFLKNPPGAAAAQHASQADPQTGGMLSARDCILSGKWLLMWLVLFCNVTAGIMFIGFQSPMLQDILARGNPGMDMRALAAAGATLIAVSSLFNGAGRFLWGGLSDRIGRIQTFRIILATQIVVFVALRYIDSPLLFSMLVCYILLCYGGGFGTMPSFVLDVFGTRLMPVVYGAILTAWSIAGVAGPQIVAVIKDSCKDAAGPLTFTIAACLLSVGFACSLFINNNPFARHRNKVI
jgi:OFA family oxalate/formate antiporter-like MFS transporter